MLRQLGSEQMTERCGHCSRRLDATPVFQFQLRGEPRLRCWKCALAYRPMLQRSAIIAGVVGTLLLAINHGDAVLNSQWAPALAWKAPLTYVVPFIVASCGALLNSRIR
jgi:hypothetical protein